VDGDAVAVGGHVRILPGGEVRGEAVSLGGKVSNEKGGLRGSSVSMPGGPPWVFDFNVMNFIGQGIRILQLAVLLALILGLGWAASVIGPDRASRVVHYLHSRPGPSFLWGLGALVAMLPSVIAVVLVGALLCITLIGIPVALLLWAGYAVGLVLLVVWGWLVG